MASLPTNASLGLEQIEEELEFQDILISTLDPAADDYAERLAELEDKKSELERRLDTVHGSHQQQSAPSSQSQNQMQNFYDPGAQDGDWWQNALTGESGNYSGFQSGVPQNGASQLGGPYQQQPQGMMKRPLPDSLQADSYHPSKRQTPDPSNVGTPTSSTESFEWIEHPSVDWPSVDRSEAARRRQFEAEANLRRLQETHAADEQFARSLQQQPQAAATSSSRPNYQTTLSYDGSYRRPPTQVKTEMAPAETYGIGHSNSTSSFDQPPQSTYTQPSQSTYIKPEPSSSRQQQLPERPRRFEVIDLTNSSDDDEEVTEIPPSGFTSRSRPYQHHAHPSNFGQNNGMATQPNNTYGNAPAVQSYQQYNPTFPGSAAHLTLPMPGAYPMADSTGSQYVYGNSSTPAANLTGWTQRNQMLTNAFNGLRSVAGTLGDPFTELSNLITGPQPGYLSQNVGMGDDDDDDLLFGGSRPVQPGTYAGYEDRDLYQRRFAEIQNYDPAKTTEEINTLLENIRPDEDMPAHLRVQTPEAMTIKLHKYQELGLTWLQKCEDGSNKGGVLADDMGLGKTIQMLSLLVTHKSEDPRCKTTLIVAPVALMRQWQQEIEQKIKPSAYHRLTVFVHHGQGKKKSFKELQHFDIVLTTYGSLAAELKKLEKFQLRKKEFPETRPNNSERCALISDDASWYRVILDEAQCIKNTNTQTSKAACRLRTTYRFCMTGTPMMNNVEEFYSLVKFLRIRPYSEWQKFRLDIASPLKQGGGKDRAMQKLQALCKAVMLRRTKQSKFEGQPILILPERTTEVDNPVFSDDEAEFYKAVEQKTKLQFNRYLKAGTVGSSYSAILVLLLRLRQACCHPHLLKDFGVAAAAGMTPDQLTDLAKELAPPVVDRIKSTGGNFECPVCYDAVVNPAIFLPCGHDTCRECFAKIADPSNAIRDGNETAAGAKCPTCRAPVDPKRITDFDSFKKIYMPNLLSAEEQDELKKFQADMEAAQESGSDSDTDSDEEDDDDDDEVDAKGNLADFVVNDDEEEFETASAADHDDTEADPSTKSSKSKGKQKMKAKPKKAKGKKREKKLKKKELKSVTLAEMKRLATRNAKAKKAYMRRLREDWMTSAKIEKTMDLLREIMRDTDEKVLIFSQWTSFLDLLEVPIDGEHWGYRRYDGSMNAQMRNDAVDDFRDHRGNVRIMLVSLKAGNAGLNLNMASQVIILDPFWNPYIEEQAIDRSHRLGQTRPVKVHRMLIEGTVEDRIIALQEKKRAIISEALDENASKNIARLGVQELAYLFGVTRNASQRIEYVPRERH